MGDSVGDGVNWKQKLLNEHIITFSYVSQESDNFLVMRSAQECIVQVLGLADEMVPAEFVPPTPSPEVGNR